MVVLFAPHMSAVLGLNASNTQPLDSLREAAWGLVSELIS